MATFGLLYSVARLVKPGWPDTENTKKRLQYCLLTAVCADVLSQIAQRVSDDIGIYDFPDPC